MSEYLKKIIRQGNCGGIKCTECDFDAFCNEVECAFPHGLIVWAAKGMLHEKEASSRAIFEWLHDLYVDVNHEITVIFNQHNRIDGLATTLVEAEGDTLYFDVCGTDVRVEKHACTEHFAEEQLLLTDILTASYTVVKDNPIIGGG